MKFTTKELNIIRLALIDYEEKVWTMTSKDDNDFIFKLIDKIEEDI